MRTDLLLIPLRHARRHPGRAALITSVAAIGVALVVSLSALLEGLERTGQARLRNVGGRVARVYQGGLTPADLEALASVEPRPARVVPADAVPVVVTRAGAPDEAGEVASVGSRAPATVIATEPVFRELFELPLLAGRFLEPGDGDPGDPGCVLDGALAARLFGDAGAAVGQRLLARVGPLELAITVKGVLVDLLHAPAAGVAYAFPVRSVYVHRDLVRRFTGDRTGAVLVQAARDEDVEPMAQALERCLAGRLRSGGRRVHTQRWALDATHAFDHQIQQLGTALSIITLASVVVTLTTLQLLALRARLEEVAVRVIEGATPGAVAMQFVLEGLLLAGLGGALGLPLGRAIAAQTALIVGWPAIPRPHVAALALLAAVVTGLLSAAAPAWRAARADPVAGLRVAMDVGR